MGVIKWRKRNYLDHWNSTGVAGAVDLIRRSKILQINATQILDNVGKGLKVGLLKRNYKLKVFFRLGSYLSAVDLRLKP